MKLKKIGDSWVDPRDVRSIRPEEMPPSVVVTVVGAVVSGLLGKQDTEIIILVDGYDQAVRLSDAIADNVNSER